MKKILGLFLLFVLITVSAEGGTVSRHTTYATNSQVTSTNLNGNFDNILNEVNAGLDNDNADTANGYRFLQVVGALPAAGTQGRVVFLTTDNTLNFDTGSTFTQAVTVSGTPATDDIIYYTGSAWARREGGKLVQVVNASTGAVITTTETVTLNDTIPTTTDFSTDISALNLAITPTSATNKLIISVVINMADSVVSSNNFIALFQDSTANALIAVKELSPATANNLHQLFFTYYMAAGTTSATTFKVRVAAASSGTRTINGESGGRLFGGVMISSITISEIIP